MYSGWRLLLLLMIFFAVGIAPITMYLCPRLATTTDHYLRRPLYSVNIHAGGGRGFGLSSQPWRARRYGRIWRLAAVTI